MDSLRRVMNNAAMEGVRPSLLIACAALMFGAVSVTTQVPAKPPTDTSSRPRLLTLQREAVELLTLAGRSQTPPDDVRRALRDASQRLEALGADPDQRSSTPEAPAPAQLTVAMRTDLRDAARKLADVASKP